jgi:hypothetical protein
MMRWALRGFVGGVALAALPVFGCSCSRSSAPADSGLPDQAVASLDDLGVGDLPPYDPCAPIRDNPCRWYAYVDAGADAAFGDTYGWPPDGGVDQCAACGFASKGFTCGYCYLAQVGTCGVAYSCELSCDPICAGVGRRPAGLVEPAITEASELARWLARAAHLEAASVPAFLRLERELTVHRAPEHLIAGARRARVDEIRHAKVMADVARAAGARIPLVDVAPVVPRPLEEVALENAVEGCVREAFGAADLYERSRASVDPLLGRVLADIAADEVRHGRLAWAIDAWARPRLSFAGRRRVDAARRAEIRAMVRAS